MTFPNKGTPDQRISKLKAYSERYGNKKIWLTEFAVAKDQNAQNVIEFIEEFLPKLEFSDFIYRYSWFISRLYNLGLVFTQYIAHRNFCSTLEFC